MHLFLFCGPSNPLLINTLQSYLCVQYPYRLHAPIDFCGHKRNGR